MERRINAPDKEFLTIDELASWLGVSPELIRKGVREGWLPPGEAWNKPTVVWSWQHAVGIAWLIGWLLSREPPKSDTKPEKTPK